MKPLILLAAIIISFPASAQSTFKSLRPLQEQMDDITDRFHAPRNVLNEEAPAPRKYPKPHSPDYSRDIPDTPRNNVRHLHAPSGEWIGYMISDKTGHNLYSPQGEWLGTIGGK